MVEEETWEEDGTGDKEFVEEVSEAAEYSSKSDFSKAQVVCTQMERCCSIRSEEMRSGFSTHVVDKIGNIKLVHVPDSRKKFMGAVDTMMNLLMPEIRRKGHEKYSSMIGDFREAKEDIKNKYLYKERRMMTNESGTILGFTGREYMPEIGDIIVSGLKPISKGVMGESRIEGAWDSKVNAYYNELLENYDILFAELNCLIDELNYFKQSMGF